MFDIESTAAAIRAVESNGDYRFQQAVTVDGGKEYKVGAYGFLGSRWKQLTEASGLAGARWNDRGAQDYVAREKLRRDYERLGDWGMAVVAFRFGTRAAQALKNAGYVTPEAIEKAGYPEVAGYLRNAHKMTPDTERRVTGTLKKNPKPQSDTRTRAEDIVRKQLYGIRNAQKGVSRGSNEGQQQVGDTGVSATTE